MEITNLKAMNISTVNDYSLIATHPDPYTYVCLVYSTISSKEAFLVRLIIGKDGDFPRAVSFLTMTSRIFIFILKFQSQLILLALHAIII